MILHPVYIHPDLFLVALDNSLPSRVFLTWFEHRLLCLRKKNLHLYNIPKSVEMFHGGAILTTFNILQIHLINAKY